MIGRRVSDMIPKHRNGSVPLELALECRAVKPLPYRCRTDTDRVEIGFDIVPREALQGGLGTQRTRRPVGFGIHGSQPAEYRFPERERQPRAQTAFPCMKPIPPVTGEVLVATIAGQRYRHLAARELTHAVG